MTVTRKAFIAGAAGGIASLFLPSLPDAPDTFPLPLGPTDAWGEELSAGARVLVVPHAAWHRRGGRRHEAPALH